MVKKNPLSTFVINPLIHIRQKEKITLKIAVKVAGVNGPLYGKDMHCSKILPPKQVTMAFIYKFCCLLKGYWTG
jgi:hypothetical protein